MRITASAPTRIDLAGGTLDIWPLFLFHDGAQTLNVAISLRAHVRLEPRDDAGVELEAVDIGRRVMLDDPLAFDERHGLPLLAHLARVFGVRGVRLRTRGESPAGAGLAGSSALNVAVCGALARWSRQTPDPEALLGIALNVEARVIGVPTGYQDYRPAMYGGIASLELGVAGPRRVPLDVDPREIERRIVLCYTGAPRHSGINNWEIMKRHLDGDRQVRDAFDRIRDAAAGLRDALVRDDWQGAAEWLAAEWRERRRLAPGVATPTIDDLMRRAAAAGGQAAKVCGAGGGGCFFCLVPPDRREAVREALAAGGARLLDFRVEQRGLALD